MDVQLFGVGARGNDASEVLEGRRVIARSWCRSREVLASLHSNAVKNSLRIACHSAKLTGKGSACLLQCFEKLKCDYKTSLVM